MTFLITDNEPRAHYSAGAAQTVFSIPFEWRSNSDIKVYVDELQKTLNVDYTLTGAGVNGGGSCTFTSAMAGGEKVTIIGDMPIARGTESFATGGQLPASVLEASLDNLTIVVKQLARDISRSLHLTPYDSAAAGDFELPAASVRANKIQTYDAQGKPSLATSIGATIISQSIIAALLWPQSGDETAAGAAATAFNQQIVVQPFRFGGVGDGVTNDTLAVQAAIDVAHQIGWNAEVDLCGRNWCVGTVRIEKSHFILRNGRLTAHASIPVGGAVILSLAAGVDAAGNNAILDAIYGVGVQTGRTITTGSLEQVRIIDVSIYGGANAVKGIWMTGFTRGCRLQGVYTNECVDAGIVINGSWSFLLENIHCAGDGANGSGMELGRIGNGTRSGSSVCNAFTAINVQCTAHANGLIYDFGSNATFEGLICEFNALDGMVSLSAVCVTLIAPYFESNGGDALQMGGTNGVDFAEEWIVLSPSFNQSAGQNMRLQGMKRCKIVEPRITGAVTVWYFITGGAGQYITECEFDCPNLTTVFIGNLTAECDTRYNKWHRLGRKIMFTDSATKTFGRLDFGRVNVKASGAGITWTIDSDANLPAPHGAVIEGIVKTGTVTLAITSDTLRHSLGTGPRTIAANGYFRAEKIDTTEWYVTGQGIT